MTNNSASADAKKAGVEVEVEVDEESHEHEEVNENTKLTSTSEEIKVKMTTMDSKVTNEKYELEKQLKIQECKARVVSRVKLVWSFISFLIALLDVVVIVVVTYLHFKHQQDMIAWLMLLPILLNFIGIFTFLSNSNERRELEELAGACKASALVKNLMILPIFGPAFSSLRLFMYAWEEENAEKFERLESLLTKMKQYESFFRAAPEAFVQITYRIVSWKNGRPFDYEDHWTSACITLCVFALAESNFYGVVRPYYRIFTDPSKMIADAWNTQKISIGWRIVLFFYTYTSIMTRLLCDALLRATMCFVFEKQFTFGEVIGITLITQFITRASVHIFILRPRENLTMKKDEDEDGNKRVPVPIGITRTVDYESGPLIYRAFTYSWRSIFMSFDFQNPDKFICGWFYVENIIMMMTAYAAALYIEYDLSEKLIYFLYTGVALICMAITFGIRLGVYWFWRRPYARRSISRVSPSPSSQSPEETKTTIVNVSES